MLIYIKSLSLDKCYRLQMPLFGPFSRSISLNSMTIRLNRAQKCMTCTYALMPRAQGCAGAASKRNIFASIHYLETDSKNQLLMTYT